MRTKRILATIAGVAIAALALTGCTNGLEDSESASSGADSVVAGGMPEVVEPLEARDIVHGSLEGKSIAFVAMLYNGFKVAEEWGEPMKSVFESLGADFTVYDSNFDIDLQLRTIDGLISSGDTDILILQNAGDLNVLNQQIKSAQDAGIYVMVLNVMTGQSPDLFVGPDGYSMGQEITTRMAEDCTAAGKTDIVVLLGPETDSWSQLVYSGIEAQAKESGLNIVEKTDTKWQADLTNQQAATALQRYGNDLCALFSSWDPTAISAAQAVKQAEQSGVIAPGAVGVYAFDASDDGCKAVHDGTIKATVVYDHHAIGFAAAAAAQMYSEVKQPAGSQRTSVFVPYQLADASNIDDITYACYVGAN
jgi:ribose transport system substrate-binding protein